MENETHNISKRDQLVVCLKWIAEDYQVQEDMVGLTQLENTTAKVIYESLKTCLLH